MEVAEPCAGLKAQLETGRDRSINVEEEQATSRLVGLAS